MNSNNYVTPQFTHLPPNYNISGNWDYTWPTSRTQTARSTQNTKDASPPPLPKYPPSYSHPPPPTVPSLNTTNSEQISQTYYNYNTPAAYRTRYSNSTTGQYNGTSQYSSQLGQYTTSPGQYSTVPPGQYMASNSPNSTRPYNSALPGQYMASNPSSQTRQYNSPQSGQYMASNSQGYNSRNYYGKRKQDSESEGFKKSNKKKKKPLSQNVPQRKDWSIDEAEKALNVEKEYNKRSKSQSLIIKFPDLELNRDIVSKFNPAIESVHFQQPSTARFCFVSLKDSADPEAIIKQLNKTPFGQGFLTAEYKKDREDEINIGPQDIDPLTLYVGNLAQEVTKEDMVNTYPKQKRIDIGYAKKMKYTRYAFVSFKTVEDSIEAFRKTHSTQMYSKSLIVRFRRLNGTVGMPGEPKPQMPQRNDTTEHHNEGPHTNMINDHIDSGSHNNSSDMETEPRREPCDIDVSSWDLSPKDTPIKEEPPGTSDDEDDTELDPSNVLRSLDEALAACKPKKVIVKKENVDSSDIPQEDNSKQISVVNTVDKDCLPINTDVIKKEIDKTGSGYDDIRSSDAADKGTDVIPLVKREVSTPTLDENSSVGEERTSIVDSEEWPRIKSEPTDEDEEINGGDDDDSEGEIDEFNFSNMLTVLEARKKKLLRKNVP